MTVTHHSNIQVMHYGPYKALDWQLSQQKYCLSQFSVVLFSFFKESAFKSLWKLYFWSSKVVFKERRLSIKLKNWRHFAVELSLPLDSLAKNNFQDHFKLFPVSFKILSSSFFFYYLGKRKTALNLTCLACQSKLNQVRVGFLNASSPSGHPLEKRKYNFLRIFSIFQEFKIENSFENQEKFKKLHLQKWTILSDSWLKRQMLASLIKQNQGKLALKSRHEIQIFMGLKIFDAKAKKASGKARWRWPPRPEMHRERMQQFTYYKHT